MQYFRVRSFNWIPDIGTQTVHFSVISKEVKPFGIFVFSFSFHFSLFFGEPKRLYHFLNFLSFIHSKWISRKSYNISNIYLHSIEGNRLNSVGFKVEFFCFVCEVFQHSCILYHVNQTKWCQIKAIASDYESRIKHNKNRTYKCMESRKWKVEISIGEMQILSKRTIKKEEKEWKHKIFDYE